MNIEVKIQWGEISQGYAVLLLVTTLSKFRIFVTISAHSVTPISEVCLEPLWSSCWDDQMDICFAIHEAALLKHEAVQILFHIDSISFQFLPNLMQKIDYFVTFFAVFGLIWLIWSQFSGSNWANSERNGVYIIYYLNCFKFHQSGFVYSKTQIHLVVLAERCYSHNVRRLVTMVPYIPH